LDAYNAALQNFLTLLAKCQGENPPNPMDVQKLAAAIVTLNTDEAKLSPNLPDEQDAITEFQEATGSGSGTGGLFQLLSKDAGNVTNLTADIENCQIDPSSGQPREYYSDFNLLLANFGFTPPHAQ